MRSFSAGAGTNYAFAFPSVSGPGTKLARAKCPKGQGEQSWARRPVRGPRCPLTPPVGITQIAGTAHGLVCFRAAIPILESNDIFEFRGRDFEDIAVFEGRHPVHRAGCDVDTVARRHLTRDALAVLFDLELISGPSRAESFRP